MAARGNRVVYRAGGFQAWYAAGPLGIEQGFTLATRPGGSRGPVRLALSLGGSLRPALVGSQIRFLTRSGRVALRYGGLVALDATGRRLPAALVLHGRRLLLNVTDSGARYPVRIDPLIQGPKLVGDCTSSCAGQGTGESGAGVFGESVAVSSDGSTALVGAPKDNGSAGAVWVFTNSGGVWSQQGSKLIGDCQGNGDLCANQGTGESDPGKFGASVALSADGNTALIGGSQDNGGVGGAWVFTRAGGAWSPQGPELVGDCSTGCANQGTGESGAGEFGASVALSNDGNTALIGAPQDSSAAGSVWVLTRSAGAWTEAQKLGAGDETGGTHVGGTSQFGYSVALSGDGSTALIGGPQDAPTSHDPAGAAWVYTSSGGSFSEQTKLVPAANTFAEQGIAVALSSDGKTALVGGPDDYEGVGAAFVYTSSGGSWSEQAELDAPDAGPYASQGWSVALSSDGKTALVGGPGDNSSLGAAWVFTSSGGRWGEQSKLVASDATGYASEGWAVALSGDASAALLGGPGSSNDPAHPYGPADGAAWAYAGQSPQPAVTSVSPSSGPAAGGTSVTITGTAFTGATAVNFGATAATGVTVDSDTQITATAPAGSGTVDVTVTTPGGTSPTSTADHYTYLAAPAVTTTALSSSQNPSMVDQSVTFTATVTPAPDGGSVNFTYNGATVCQGVPVSAGEATCQTTPGQAGTYPVLATYSGDASYQGSTSPTLSQMVAGTATTTTLRSSTNPSTAGQTVTYTATVSPAPDGGTVSFTDGETAIPGCGTAAVSAGAAKCSVTYQAPGTHSIIATYSGDARYGAGDTTSLTEIVNQVATAVTLTSAPNPSEVGQPVTYTATVSPAPDGGTVRIADLGESSFVCESLPVSAAGRATCSITYPAAGQHMLAATYVGDANYEESFSDTITQNVKAYCTTVAQGLYVTQGTQRDAFGLVPSGRNASGAPYQGVTLVAGKTTVVRLYANAPSSPAGLPGVVAELYGYGRHGHALAGSPLKAPYGPSTLPDLGAGEIDEIVGDKELESDGNAYTFTLPGSWDSAGGSSTVKLVGKVQVLGPSQGCQSSSSFTLSQVKFTEVGASYYSTLTPVPMTVNGKQPPPPAQVFQDAGAVTPLPDGALGAQPYAAAVDITDIATSCQRHGHTAKAECQNQRGYALSRLEKLYPNTTLHLVGVTLENYGDTGGSNYSVVGYDPNDSHHDGGSPGSNDRPLTSVSHELFHQFGLVHAGNECGGGEDNDKDDGGQTGEPWPPDGNGDLDGIGLDPTTEPYQFIANGANQIVNGQSYYNATSGPYQTFDFMSYCTTAGLGDPGDWVSPKNWQQLVSNFGTGHPAADLASRASAATGANTRDPLAADVQVEPSRLSVLGFVTRAGVSLTSVGPQVGPPGPRGNSLDSFTLTARGADGRVLASVPMATTGGHIDPVAGADRTLDQASAGPLVQISADVPSAGVDSLQVADNGTVVATQTRPAKAPHVRVLAPRAGSRVGSRGNVLVRWKATNPEHLELTATIDYSRDGGRTWRTIFIGPNTSRASLPSFYFTASRLARVRVRVNDGFNETDAVSRRFTAAGAPPVVTILTAFAPQMHLAGDASAQLEGGAVDQDDQVLSGKRLQWYDGPFRLGTGADISAGPLPPGKNHLRLVARDPAGRTASATLTVTVSPVHLTFLKLRLPKRVGAGTGNLAFQASASIPCTLTIGRHKFKLTTKSKRFHLTIGPGKASLLLQLNVAADGITTPFAAEIKR